ncbi:MAG TPA: LytTR family DNA-binding domain-containing protein [Chitinophagaceae bacterium]
MSFMILLAKPYPLLEGARNKFTTAFAFGAFVFLFLYFFKPFGIGTFTAKQIFFYALGFGGVTFAIMFINLLILDRIFPSFFREENWTVGREIFITLIHIAFIGLGNYLFSAMLSITDASFDRLLYFEFISICIGVFPIVVWTLIKENRLLKQSKEEAKTFDPLLHPEKQITTVETRPEETQPGGRTTIPSITFTSESETATIKAVPEQVFFISSADNYIKIYLSEGNAIITKLLRSSLKKTENDLKNHPQFYRCHRAYIVNLQKVASVTGNARGLKLTLENCPEEVPVSRSVNDEIKLKLGQRHSC